MLRTIPEKWGRRTQIDGGAVASTHSGPGAVHYNLNAHAVLIFFTPERNWQISTNTDRRSTGVAPAGTVEIIPSGSEVFAQWSCQKHSLRLDIKPARLMRVAGNELDTDTFELRPPRLGFVDENAHHIARLMRRELQRTAGRKRRPAQAVGPRLIN